MNNHNSHKTKTIIPELNHHSPQSRRSRALAQVLPTSQRRWNSSSQKHAFTIIEVVLVLAIAGLIFLMVFIALPELQRSQRNTGYKNNLSIVTGLLQTYKTNNKGQYPPDDPAVDQGFMVGDTRYSSHPFYGYVQNSGLQDGISIAVRRLFADLTPSVSTWGNTPGRIVIHINARCSTPSGSFGSFTIYHSPNKTAIWTILEEGASGLIYCQDI